MNRLSALGRLVRQPLLWVSLSSMSALVIGGATYAAAPSQPGRVAADLVETAEEDMAIDKGPVLVDYGTGPVRLSVDGQLQGGPVALPAQSRSPAPDNGGPEAHLLGAFGPVFTWPVIPIHAVLLPDGRVITYGTDLTGVQGAKLYYVVWDPTLGVGSDAIMTLPNTTDTSIFCAGQGLIPSSGELLIVGGDTPDAWNRRNYGVADVNRFNPGSNSLVRQGQSMQYRRWYASVITMATGEQVVLGGRVDRAAAATNRGAPRTENVYASTPEVFSPTTGWRTLTGATSEAAYGGMGANYNYPRAWLAPNGKIFVLGNNERMFSLDTSGSGSLQTFKERVPRGMPKIPSVMFEPGRILSVRRGAQAVVIDINGDTPVVTPTGSLSQHRENGMAVLLADGQVMVSGGSSGGNVLEGAAYRVELWNSGTGTWRLGAEHAKPRLYHSTALLLADGTVFTGGGGAQGPVNNLNGQIFYPPYLFKKDGSGDFAPRPEVVSAPTRQLAWGESFGITLAPGTSVSRVTLVRTGAATHSFNTEQRFKALPFKQVDDRLRLKVPADRNMLPPGYYILFVFDADGVPSVGRVVRLNDGA